MAIGFQNKFITKTGGAADEEEGERTSLFAPHNRQRVNIRGVCANIFLPWLLFVSLYSQMIFSWHYLQPLESWILVFLGFCLSAVTWFMAWRAKQRDRAAMWYTYSALMFFLATLLAAIFGNYVFWTESKAFYDFGDLNTYASVNPAHYRGEMVMDSGRVYFAEGTHLDVKKSIGFKNKDMYCVVPIGNGPNKLQTYDFWAVGMNCCENPNTFHCGEDYNNFKARSALRLLDSRDEQRFYRLAVQQAEAAYGITAQHPVFYQWTQDPLSIVNGYHQAMFKYFLIGVFTYFIFNLFCVVCATIAFSKMNL